MIIDNILVVCAILFNIFIFIKSRKLNKITSERCKKLDKAMKKYFPNHVN